MNPSGSSLRALELEGRLLLLRFFRRRSLRALGERLSHAQLTSDELAAQSVLARVASEHHRLGSLRAASSDSLVQDRRDYAAVAGWARPLVVGRGLLERRVLSARARALRQALAPLHRELAERLLDGELELDPASREAFAAEVKQHQETRRVVAALQEELAVVLTTLGGRVVPAWLKFLGAELWLLVWTLFNDVRLKMLPRLPALAGMAAGYWVTRTFTDSRVENFFSQLGLHHSRRHFISSERMTRLHFWLPLLAGAACSYLSSRLGAFIRNRYAVPVAVADFPPESTGAAGFLQSDSISFRGSGPGLE